MDSDCREERDLGALWRAGLRHTSQLTSARSMAIWERLRARIEPRDEYVPVRHYLLSPGLLMALATQPRPLLVIH